MNSVGVIDLFSKGNIDYGFAIGKVRVLETRLLDKTFFEDLIGSDNLESALGKLQQTDYSGILKDPAGWGKGLELHYNYILHQFTRIVPEPGLLRLFRLRYDFHNIKIIFKQKLGVWDKLDRFIDLGTVSLKVLSESIFKERYSSLPRYIARASRDAWHMVLKDKDPRLVTILLDRWLYHTLYHEAEEKNLFLKRFFSTWIDLYNIKAFFRAKKLQMGKEFFDKYFLHHGTIDRYRFEGFYEDSVPDILEQLVTSPYFGVVEVLLSTWAQDRSLLRVDKAIDDFITRLLRRAGLIVFGIEPVISYIWAKEMELKNLRLALIAIQYGLDRDWIKEHIREV